MTELLISAARASDLSEIVKLEAEAFPAPWKREFFASELEMSGRYNTTARSSEGAFLGYMFAMHFLDEMHVNKIAVNVESRRSGVAAALMADCFRFAGEQEIRSISLEVRETNEGAQAFYRKLAFESVYRRANYYPDGEAAMVMVRQIG